jgi:hypothetical protein
VQEPSSIPFCGGSIVAAVVFEAHTIILIEMLSLLV